MTKVTSHMHVMTKVIKALQSRPSNQGPRMNPCYPPGVSLRPLPSSHAVHLPAPSARSHTSRPPACLQVIKDVKDPFIRNWLDLLCFLLSGLPANGTIAAEVAFMFNEWYRPNCMVRSCSWLGPLAGLPGCAAAGGWAAWLCSSWW
jgi:hypothetical protein